MYIILYTFMCVIRYVNALLTEIDMLICVLG